MKTRAANPPMGGHAAGDYSSIWLRCCDWHSDLAQHHDVRHVAGERCIFIGWDAPPLDAIRVGCWRNVSTDAGTWRGRRDCCAPARLPETRFYSSNSGFDYAGNGPDGTDESGQDDTVRKPRQWSGRPLSLWMYLFFGFCVSSAHWPSSAPHAAAMAAGERRNRPASPRSSPSCWCSLTRTTRRGLSTTRTAR